MTSAARADDSNITRTWKDVSGRFQVKAELIDATDVAVMLRKPGGEEIIVPLGKLSPADRKFLADWKKPPPVKINDDNAIRLGEPVVVKMRIGMEFTGEGNSKGVRGIVTVPMAWPEQEVTASKPETTPNVGSVSFRELDGGARQMVILVPKLGHGEVARATVDYEIKRHPIELPKSTEGLKKPSRPDRELRQYLIPGPLTESRNAKIVSAAAEAVDTASSPWQQASDIHQWVVANVRYQERPEIKSASVAMAEGVGDCQEMSSLFVAMCRAQGIPARCVWVHRHNYAEFYLEDAAGRGHWYPVESTNDTQFGYLPRTTPILQKGDNFKLPEFRERLHFARTTVTGQAGPGGGQPQFKEIFEVLK